MQSHSINTPFIVAVLFAVATTALPLTLQAQNIITVTTTDDENNSDGDCSLREAIIAANDNTTTDACIHDGSALTAEVIVLTAGSTYTLDGLTTSGENLAAQGDLDIASSAGVTIRSSIVGSAATIDGNDTDRVLHIRSHGGDLTLQDLTIQNGTVADYGAGIYLEAPGGTFLFERVTITSNNITGAGATRYGAGIFADMDAIDSESSVTFRDCVVSDNTISSSGSSDGAGISFDGDSTFDTVLLIENCAITGNQTDSQGAGVFIFGGGSDQGTIAGSTISNNTADQGAGLYSRGMSLQVLNSTLSSNSAADGAGVWVHSHSVTLQGTAISGNTASTSGGGVYASSSATLTIENSTVSGNTASSSGGGIYDLSAGNTLSISNTTISGNKAGSSGPGIRVNDDGTPVGSLTNSIVTLNVKTDDTALDECSNTTFSSGSNNLIDDTSCFSSGGCVGGTCGTSVTNFTVTLASNGGPTQTHAITSASNAVDAGTSCGLTSDQRGFSRDATCDVGAFEGDSDADPGIYIAGTAGTGNDTGWRMMAAPCSGRTRASLSLNANISGDDEVRTYDQSDGAGDAAWEEVGSSDALTHGRGFIAYLYDDATETVGTDFSISFDGCTQPTGDVTTTGLDTSEEWYLAGNPFYESFDLSSLTFTGHQAIVKIWDPTAGGSGSYRNVVIGSENDKLAMGQGFFVQRTSLGAGATQLDYASAGRTTGGSFVGKSASSDTWRRIGFHVAGTSLDGTSVFDEASEILFLPEGKMGWDRYESTKNTPLSATFLTISPIGDRLGDEELLSLASYPEELTSALEIPLQVDSRGFTGQVYLSWPMLDNVPASWTVELKDHVTGGRMDLKRETGYHFFHESAGGKAATAGEILKQPVALEASILPSRFTLVISPVAGVNTAEDEVPVDLVLYQNYPNPFNPESTISFALPRTSSVRLAVYDIVGRQVRLLVDGTRTAGTHSIRFNGESLASGTYIYRLETPNQVITRRLLLVK